ncbi:T9SS type B sorting domain-containing protein [Chryseobacterium sp. SNU WT5]|uniref:T9SS type B sorting domain-containing protein n=1 Tax=Chryseobacterium sp. SNU WT5 TaxID=2594269 RepID=UPI001627BCE5|nr:T9SS type B sorting domain-containing protein [Chryseobacterium sp. SNU WT5]
MLFTSSLEGQDFCNVPKITDILGNEDVIIDCAYPLNNGACLPLKVAYPSFKETTSYSVDPANFSPYAAFNSGTPLNANADDLFTDKLKLPFNFCYFGTNYNEVIIGSNGVITFDIAQLGKVNYPNVDELNPSISLPKSAIFGVFSDMVFSNSNDSEIYYSVIGTAPCRKFIVNFYKGRLLGCDQTVTSQIVLSEGSNNVEIFIENKPLICSDAKFNKSLVGIINTDRDLGYSPPDRNSGVWETQNEAWIFAPNGATVVPQIAWFNSSNQQVGTGDQVNVCPEKNEIYTAKITYPICGNENLVLQDTASVTFAPDYPLAKNHTEVFCGSNSVNVNLDAYIAQLTPQNPANLKFSFHNSLADAQNNVNEQPKTFNLTANKVFYVRVQNPSDPTCFRTAILNLNLITKSLLATRVSICDVDNNGVENNFQLSPLNSKLFASPINGTIHYFLNQADADNNLNEIFTTNIVDNSQYYVNYKTASCTQTFGPITINLVPAPVLNTPISFSYTTCDYKRDLTEPFEFEVIIGPLITKDPTVTLRFYKTYEQAYSGTGATVSTVKEGQYPIFVRAEFPGGCFSVATVNLNITFTKVEAIDRTAYICFDGKQDISINIDDYAPKMLIDSPVGIVTTYFASSKDADDNVNPISNSQIIDTNGNFVTKTFYVRFEDATGCYAIKALTINLVHVIIAKTQFEICDFYNNGEEVITLSSISKEIAGNQNATVSYFTTLADAQKNLNAISIFNVQNSAKLFVRIQSYGCSDVFEITIRLGATPILKTTVDIVKDAVCDNNNDGYEPVDLTKFQSKIYAGSEPVTFQYFTGYNDSNQSLSGLIASPTSYIIPGAGKVYAKVSAVGGCYSVSTINIKLNFLPGIVVKKAALQKCDYEFNLNESFNLPDAIPQLFVQSENSNSFGDLEVTYYRTDGEANAGIPSTRINAPVVTINSKTTVWARFTSKLSTCYSIAPIELQTYLPPKAKISTIPDLCDENLDGLYDVNLMNFTSRMVYTQSADNIFSFFYTQSDANQNINPIKNPESLSLRPTTTRIWMRVENIPGCFDTASVDLTFGNKIIFDNAGPFFAEICDDGNDGSQSVDLTQYESTIYKNNGVFEYYPTIVDINNNSNKISNPKDYLFNENLGPKKIYAKVNTAGFCPDLVEINLSLKKTPMFRLPDYYFCPNGTVNIDPDFSNLDIVNYEWMNPTSKVLSVTDELHDVGTEGVYTINVTSSNGCTFTTNFNVIMYEVPIITNLVASGNSYTVIATGSKKILYSIDGSNYQPNNIFHNLPYGVTTFYVKFEGSDCIGVIKKGLILNIKNVFTPNNDGINDTWIIDDLNVFEGAKTNLKVYNRLQEKIFEQESATRLEWDGKTLSRVVPTDSYWYVLTLADGRIFTGWVLVKDRN